ncbi:MAG: hypothetical protein D6762_09330 [Candidatus Neomarinimicrobiota bacterium]|nr:MAG: hypothetical protein D6762_09330 [Candidatus Neomarinimicrobiota bacterium]
MQTKSYLPTVVLILVLGLFLYPMMFQGLVPAANDTVSRLPINEWIKHYHQEHHSKPEWFPMLFSGMPAYGSYITGYQGPVSSLLMGSWINRGFRYFFFFLIGGLGVYVFLRRQAHSPLPALLGAISYSLTPYMFGLINAGHASKMIAISYIPWVFLTVDMVLRQPGWKAWLSLVMASGLQLWSNHPQVTYYTWMLAGFWWLWTLIRRWKSGEPGPSSWLTSGLIVGGLVLSLVMVADPYASVYSFQQHSNRGAESVLDKSGETDSGTKWEYATQWSYHPLELVAFINPYYFGLQNFPTRDVKSAAYWGYMPFTQSTHYLGLIPLLLAILGFWVKRNREWDWFFLTSTVLILVIGFGKYFPPLFWLLYKFAPFFGKFRVPSMIYILLPFIFSVWGAMGLSRILSTLTESSEVDRQRLKRSGLILFGTISGLSLLLLLFGGNFLSLVRAEDLGRYQDQVLAAIKSARLALFQKGAGLAFALSGAALAGLWLTLKKQLPVQGLALMLIALTVIDYWIVDREFLALKPERNLTTQFRRTKADRFLQENIDHARILPLNNSNTNRYAYFGIPSVSGYRPVKLRLYQDLLDAQGLSSFPVLDMLNVKYLISNKTVQHPRFRTVFTDGQTILENRGVLPKAWFVSSVRSVETSGDALDRIVNQTFAPDSLAVVEDRPQLAGRYSVGTVILQRYEPNAIELATDNPGDGFLVLSEVYYPLGWRAMLDDRPIDIVKTNFLLRGFRIPAGKHTLNLSYRDPYRSITGPLSRAVFGLVFLGWVVLLWRERKQQT